MFSFQSCNEKPAPGSSSPISYNSDHESFKEEFNFAKRFYEKLARGYNGEISDFKGDRLSELYQ